MYVTSSALNLVEREFHFDWFSTPGPIQLKEFTHLYKIKKIHKVTT